METRTRLEPDIEWTLEKAERLSDTLHEFAYELDKTILTLRDLVTKYKELDINED